MKLNTHSTFTPKTFSITVESEDELAILQAIFNLTGTQLMEQLNKSYTAEEQKKLNAYFLKAMQMPLYFMVSK